MKDFLFFPKHNAIYVLFLILGLTFSCQSRNNLETDKFRATEAEKTAQDNIKTFVFDCEHNFSFVARLEGENMWLFLPGSTLTLPHVRSASGLKYQKGNTVFWSKDGDFFLEWEGNIFKNCRNNHAKAIWENAKFNGVEFRAIGNEPGWYLEFYLGDKIVLTTDYGQKKYIFPYVKADENLEDRTSRWRTQNDKHELEVMAKAAKCYDSMSGEPFESSVTVKLDGKEYHGCGKALF